MSRDFRLYLADIIQSCDRISSYIDGHGLESFSDDLMTIDAVARNLEIIGEAVKNVPLEILAQEPEILWSDVARFRDVIAHQYFRVNLTVVWNVAQEEVDLIRSAASRILSGQPPFAKD